MFTVLKERLQIFNPANSDKTPLSAASSSQSAAEVETKATAKLSESDYKDLIKIISEQMVRDGDILNIERYINILDQLSENINRDNKRLESREDDEVSLVQSLIEDYCSGSSLVDVKTALEGQKIIDDKAKLQIVEKNGFLGRIIAARYDNKQTAGDDSIKEYNERPAKKARVDSTLGIT